MWIVIAVVALLLLGFWLGRSIKNQYGTFGDDDYDYDQEARDRGWIDKD